MIKEAYFYCVLEKPAHTLLSLLFAAFLLSLPLNQLRLDASADALTLEYDKDLDYFREIYQRYQSGDFLVISYEAKADLFSDQTLDHMRSLRDALLSVEGVISANSILDVPLLYSPPISLRDIAKGPKNLLDGGVDRQLARKEFVESPIYRDMLLGPDGKTTAILLNLTVDNRAVTLVRERDALRLKRDREGLTTPESLELQRISREFLEHSTRAADRNHARVAEIRDVINGYRDRAHIFLGGVSMITADMISFIRSDLIVFGSGIIIFIIILLSIIFRQWQFVLLPLVTCLLSVLMMLGFLSSIDWRMTVISSNFVALLLIVCLAITVHLIVRYREFLTQQPRWTQKQAVRATIEAMSKPCLYTVTTTMVAFASLVISGIRPVIDFGLMMTLGLCLAFILAFLVIPTGLLLLPMGRGAIIDDNGCGAFTLHFSRLTQYYGKGILIVSATAAAISYLGIRQLDVENRFIDYFRDSTEIYQGMRVIDQQLGGTITLDIILDYRRREKTTGNAADDDPFGETDPFAEMDPFAAPASADPLSEHRHAGTTKENYWFTQAGLHQIQQLHDYLEQLPEVGKVQSLASAYKVASELNGKPLNDFELAVIRASLPEQIKALLITPYLAINSEQTRITMRVRETDPNLRRAQLVDKIRNYAIDEIGLAAEQVNITGMLVLYNNMLQSLFRSQILTIGAVFAGIMLMFLVLFRSLSLAFIAIVPNLLAAAIVLGGMGWTGVPLDMMTITIAAIAVGIGVDNAIHYIYRFRREYAIDNDYIAAMHRSHSSIGRAMYYTSITIIIGFSILALSNFIPSVYFGLLTGLAMSAAILGSLTLLPSLMLLVKPLK